MNVPPDREPGSWREPTGGDEHGQVKDENPEGAYRPTC